MAPDADKMRQRRAPLLESDGVTAAAVADPNSTTESRLVSKISSLRPNEVAIDGIIYDMDSFDHPGGESFKVFGGNDVTIQYKMIHPYHTSKHLEKMRCVGKVVDYKCEYKFDTEFEREIKREVFKIVHRGREFGTNGYWARAVFYIALFFYLQYLWVTQGASWKLGIMYGVSQALIGLNVQHDGNHGAASKTPWINDLLGLGADLVGGCSWLWLQQHWTHHTYTNHDVKDPDVHTGEPLILFNDYPPGHPNRRWYHNLQAFYYIFLACGYWLSSVLDVQVVDLKHRQANSGGIQMDNDYIKSSRKYAVGLRILYIYLNVIRPFQIGGLNWRVFTDIMIMGVAGSLTLSLLFTVSHNFEGCDRDPTAEAKKNGEPVCWFKAQVETSCTYGGAIAGALTGGLNFQVEHHLFPRMSSAWYPYIAPKIREICAKHGVKYAYYPWVWQNMYSTMKYLHQAGTGSNWRTNPYSGKA